MANPVRIPPGRTEAASEVSPLPSSHRDAALQDGQPTEAGTPFGDWLVWATQQADRIDPLKESPTSLIDRKSVGTSGVHGHEKVRAGTVVPEPAAILRGCAIHDRARLRLTDIPGSPFPAGTNLVAVAVDPRGPFAYVTNRNSDGGWASGYTIDAETGALISPPARLIRCRNVSPSMYGITKNSTAPDSPESISGRMCGWVSCAAMRISRKNLSTPLGEDFSCENTLIATARSCRASRARYTSAIPPTPSGAVIS
jgi:hypothetical protein